MKSKALVTLRLITLAAFTLAGHAQTFSVIYSFQGEPSDAFPIQGVTVKGSTLYGTAGGGANCEEGIDCGTVYQLRHIGSNWVESLIFQFPTPGGAASPDARALFGPDGHLYGTAETNFFVQGSGSVYRLTPPSSICKTAACSWTAADIHTFTGRPDGAYPQSGDLVWDQQGNIYGTTSSGGKGSGTVFQMTGSGDNWMETPIYSFGSNSGDGCTPASGVVMDGNGNLFGTTSYCGANFEGTVYELTYDPQAGWKETTLYTFTGGSDGGHPLAGVTLDSSGNLYGATLDSGQGPAVFELTPSGNTWIFKVLYEFPVGWGGPWASLSLDAAGNLYGTTHSGGADNKGSVFKLTNTVNGWVYTSLHDFTGGADGAFPESQVTIDTDGTLYGTAYMGGNLQGSCASDGCGTVWMIKP